MAYENVVDKSYVTHVQTRSGDFANTTYGDGTEVYDNNFGTFYGIFTKRTTAGWATTTALSTHTWVSSITVPKIKVKVYAAGKPYGNFPAVDLTVYVDLLVSGSWVRVATVTDNTSGATGVKSEISLDSEYNNSGDGWEVVTGIRGYSKGRAYTFQENETEDAWSYVYEIQCFKTILKMYGGVI